MNQSLETESIENLSLFSAPRSRLSSEAGSDFLGKRAHLDFLKQRTEFSSKLHVREVKWAGSEIDERAPGLFDESENKSNSRYGPNTRRKQGLSADNAGKPENVRHFSKDAQMHGKMVPACEVPAASATPTSYILERGLARIRNLLESSELCGEIPVTPISIKTQNLWADYQEFRAKHKSQFEMVAIEAVQNDPLKEVVLRFLVDVLARKDLNKLNGSQLLMLEKFIFDRYFKFLKSRIFKAFEKKRVFVDFTNNIREKLGFAFAKDEKALDFNKIYKHYTSYLAKINDDNILLFGFNLNLFQTDFIEICKNIYQASSNLNIFLGRFSAILMVFLVKSLFYLIAKRFTSSNCSFSEIENLETLALRIGASFMVTASLSLEGFFRERRTLSNEDTDRLPNLVKELETSMGLIGQICDWDQRDTLFSVIEYIKQRELRESLTRKKKASFTKPKRNDEKLKKVYKQLMRRMNTKFLSEFEFASKNSILDNEKNLDFGVETAGTDKLNGWRAKEMHTASAKGILEGFELQKGSPLPVERVPSPTITENDLNHSLCGENKFAFSGRAISKLERVRSMRTHNSDNKHNRVTRNLKSKKGRKGHLLSQFVSDIFASRESQLYLSDSEEDMPLFTKEEHMFFPNSNLEELDRAMNTPAQFQISNNSPQNISHQSPTLSPKTNAPFNFSRTLQSNNNTTLSSLSSRQREQLFYEHFFSQTSARLNISIESFFDPLKQKYINPDFKSFTSKYFQMLLRSDAFKRRAEVALSPEQLVLDVLKELPSAFEGQGPGTGLGLIHQHLPRAKFPWTVFEFFFALSFFKLKFKL